jgi:hypothetical protein
MLVGKDTKLPDYLVLISTLGGIAVFGANGFVIGPVIAALFVTVWDIFAGSRNVIPSSTPVIPSSTPVIPSSTPVIPSSTPVIPSEARDPAGLPAMPGQDPSLRSG